MKNFILPKLKFEKDKRYVLYNWEDSNSDFYKNDKFHLLYFFIKDKGLHGFTLKKLIGPILQFGFTSLDINGSPKRSTIPNSDYSWYFVSYKSRRLPDTIDWSGLNIPIKKDENLTENPVKKINLEDYLYSLVE